MCRNLHISTFNVESFLKDNSPDPTRAAHDARFVAFSGRAMLKTHSFDAGARSVLAFCCFMAHE